ncbi:lipoate--protein ligase family protein [bacterium]|nr:lipoate--protein ligase family protein [bacterium]
MRTRYLDDLGGRPGFFNMAADDMLAGKLPDDEFHAALRFYTWDPPTVSLGCHQTIDAIDLKACTRIGWDAVYRSTGGRALLHLNDLSYSIIIPSRGDSYRLFRRLYEGVGRAIKAALNELGMDAAITKPSDKYHTDLQRLRAGLCLDSKVRGEVTVSGKKVAAAAQHVYRDCLLQHGSIMINGDPGAIALVSNLTESEREVMADRLRARASSLDEISGRKIDINMLAEIIKKHMSDIIGLEVFADSWTEDEIRQIEMQRDGFEILSHRKEDLRVEMNGRQ